MQKSMTQTSMKENKDIYATSLNSKLTSLQPKSTIIYFRLGQTPANLTATSCPSEGRLWATRRGAPLVTPPKWRGRLEMAIATTAITAMPTIPPVRP